MRDTLCRDPLGQKGTRNREVAATIDWTFMLHRFDMPGHIVSSGIRYEQEFRNPKEVLQQEDQRTESSGMTNGFASS